MSVWFTKDSALGRVLLAWWEQLDTDRASRAILRRASSVTAVALTPPYQRLFRRLCAAGWPCEAPPYLSDRLAAAVGLLAHVDQNDERAPAETMSRSEDDSDRPPVSELRFQRVLDSPDLDSLFIGIRRVLPLMRRRANILTLTNDVIHWDDSVRKKWAYSYVWPDRSAS